MPREIVGVILAGGESRRMGTDKAFLKIGGVSLMERTVQTLLLLFPTVAIVSKEPEKFHPLKGISLIQDLFPEQHALGGVYSALRRFQRQDCFVFACDMPFLNPLLIRTMIEQRNGYDLFIPRSRHGLEPLHAIYTSRCLSTMIQQIERKEWNLETFVQKVHYGILDAGVLHAFDPEEASFLNVNTPEAFQKAQTLLLDFSKNV